MGFLEWICASIAHWIIIKRFPDNYLVKFSEILPNDRITWRVFMFINIDLLHIVFSNVSIVALNVKWNVGNRYNLYNIVLKRKMQEQSLVCNGAVPYVIRPCVWFSFLCFCCVYLTMEGTTEKDCSPLWSLYQQIVSDMKVGHDISCYTSNGGTNITVLLFDPSVPLSRWIWTNYLFLSDLVISYSLFTVLTIHNVWPIKFQL